MISLVRTKVAYLVLHARVDAALARAAKQPVAEMLWHAGSLRRVHPKDPIVPSAAVVALHLLKIVYVECRQLIRWALENKLRIR